MDPRRSIRVSEAIREELEEMISYELSDPRININAVAEVLISQDGRRARARLLMPGDAESQKQTLDALDHAKGFLKHELATRLDLFRMPELQFEAAIGVELGPKLDQLMKRVRRGRPRTGEPLTTTPETPSE